MKTISRRAVLRAVPVLSAAAWAAQAHPFTVFAAVAPPLNPEETVKAAQAEGRLNVALAPNDWANYSEIITAFANKYGIAVKAIDLKGDSANVLPLLKQTSTNANDTVDVVDVIDVHLPVGVIAQQQGLLATYKPVGWAKIPRHLKDAQGHWAGSHFGVLAFEVNRAVVKNPPQSWADLLRPEYAGQFALAGDPRKSLLAMNSVLSAGLASGGSANAGLRFFDQLNKAGTLLPNIATAKTIANGQTPISFRWDYHAMGDRDRLTSQADIGIVIPQRGVVARVFVQGISAIAPHPYAARAWLNFLYSDEGQVLLLKGYARSTWFADLLRRKAIPAELLAKLLAPSAYARTFFPSPAQSDAARQVITQSWDSVVGVPVG
jgi:putative spermidine/putrescine transport system substrate-binding protein